MMYSTIQEMLLKSQGISHRYLRPGTSPKKAVVVITSNRGLAGGYNANVVRLVTGSGLKPEDVKIFAVGRKGRDALARKGYEIAADHSDVINEPLYSDAMEITRELLSLFEKQEIGEIYLAYTSFQEYGEPDPAVHEAPSGGYGGGGAQGRRRGRWLKAGSPSYEL